MVAQAYVIQSSTGNFGYSLRKITILFRPSMIFEGYGRSEFDTDSPIGSSPTDQVNSYFGFFSRSFSQLLGRQILFQTKPSPRRNSPIQTSYFMSCVSGEARDSESGVKMSMSSQSVNVRAICHFFSVCTPPYTLRQGLWTNLFVLNVMIQTMTGQRCVV